MKIEFHYKKIQTVFFFIIINFSFSSHPIYEHALPYLSDYGFFKLPISKQIPNKDVIPYTIASQLFSDYAEKLRFIRVPIGTSISYNDDGSFNYPEGTFLIKTFYYFSDFRGPKSNRRLIETRLLKKISSEWISIPYVWNDDQNEAVLTLAGDRKDVSWVHSDGKLMNILYSVPNMNQCKSCHVYKGIQQPIGPKLRNLNLEILYKNIKINQITNWVSLGILDDSQDLSSISRTVNYMDIKDGSLNDRARAWLDINCAHCHQKGGPAETSGLFLNLEEKNATALGIFKPPVAAGRGSGNRKYNIVPGHPEESILQFRITSTDPGIMMPELNRRLVHQEGIQLIQDWIKSLSQIE